jgi:hypothetical protein
MDDLTITVKHLQRGQPGPYAPHTYESEITITGARSWDHLLEGQLKNLIKAVVHPFTEEKNDGSMNAHFRPRLKALTKVSEEKLSDGSLGPQREVWRARVEIPYTD